MSALRLRRLLALTMPVLLLALRPGDCLAAQAPRDLPVHPGGALLGTPLIPEHIQARQVRISLEHNRLELVQDGRVVWSARIGTGTGEVLEGAGQRWDFSTPPGHYRVQLKERDPVWVLPDWYFVERDEPLPAWDAPERRLEDELGDAAVYLTEEIAIHGTDSPQLLGGAISHGCIRMSNEDVMRLYREVEVGTPVIIH